MNGMAFWCIVLAGSTMAVRSKKLRSIYLVMAVRIEASVDRSLSSRLLVGNGKSKKRETKVLDSPALTTVRP